MPTRRTSPRRGATRPTALIDRVQRAAFDEEEVYDDPPGGLAGAAPWLALLALVVAAATLGYVLFLRPGGDADLTACRTAAWSAIPDPEKLPEGWALGSTDLNANGMTISILGATSPDTETEQPAVYASITCYGDAAAAALTQYREAATASGATITERKGGSDAFDVTSTSGSITTLFRVRSLVGQIADAGTAPTAELQTISAAVAAAMGDGQAAGTAGPAPSDDIGQAGPSDELESDEPAESAFAPELEAVLPATIDAVDPSGGSPTPVTLSKLSASASDIFGTDPSARALAARIRALGSTMDKLQVAQAYDESGTVDLSIVAFRLPGADLDKLREAIIDTWLSAGADGVKTTSVTLAGKSMSKVDYGDSSTIEYVYAKSDYVIVIDTADVAVAEAVAAKLP